MSSRTKLRILIIDDQPDEVDPLVTLLNDNSTQYEMSAEKAVSKVEAFGFLENQDFNLIFLDIIWEDGEMKPTGIQILEEIKSSVYGNIPVIMLTNYSQRGYQKISLDLGCDGFLAKDRDLKIARLGSVEYMIEKALRMGEMRKTNLIYQQPDEIILKGGKKSVFPYRKPIALFFEKGKPSDTDYQKIAIYGTSKPMTELFLHIIRISAEPASPNVLIIGETGVGKSTVARLIHFLCDRSKGPFHEVVLNAIPTELIESTLFGIEAKVATGVQANTGLIEECEKGTLFLDEIGELPLSIQVKLLRAIRDKVITRVGGKTDIKVDFKLISATNQNLRTLVKEGKFRLDLFQRLCGVELSIPTLRRRFQEDHSELDDLLQREMAQRRFTFDFTQEAKNCMLKHDWPGNYAELKTLLDNISLESASFVDENMVAPRLLRIDEAAMQASRTLTEMLDIPNHKLAVNVFKREHVDYWIEKSGSLKRAATVLDIDESTIHRILGKDQEQQ
ncbi:MAG: sigma-54-dependent Fis family transcriptional regulator [Ignavibacteriae bacterium]|nr:sigma-54-dependent Fis family transcriptional regulator [Ignavibacteriota bacterium]